MSFIHINASYFYVTNFYYKLTEKSRSLISLPFCLNSSMIPQQSLKKKISYSDSEIPSGLSKFLSQHPLTDRLEDVEYAIFKGYADMEGHGWEAMADFECYRTGSCSSLEAGSCEGVMAKEEFDAIYEVNFRWRQFLSLFSNIWYFVDNQSCASAGYGYQMYPPSFSCVCNGWQDFCQRLWRLPTSEGKENSHKCMLGYQERSKKHNELLWFQLKEPFDFHESNLNADENISPTLQLWAAQLGQKHLCEFSCRFFADVRDYLIGLLGKFSHGNPKVVRYTAGSHRRPTIMKKSVFYPFGRLERAALADFEFLNRYAQDSDTSLTSEVQCETDVDSVRELVRMRRSRSWTDVGRSVAQTAIKQKQLLPGESQSILSSCVSMQTSCASSLFLSDLHPEVDGLLSSSGSSLSFHMTNS